MVKLAGPAMSLDASGTIGGILTFSKWKGRPYVRTRVIPSNPKSPAQQGVRAMMKFLAQSWANIGAPAQASWDVGADARKISPFNQYSGINQSSWRDFLPPGKTNTLLRVTAPGLITATAPGPSGRYAMSNVTIAAAAGQWGLIVYMSSVTGFDPNWNNARLIVPALPAGNTLIQIGPLAAGTYYLRYHTFSNDGLTNQAYITEDTVVIV